MAALTTETIATLDSMKSEISEMPGRHFADFYAEELAHHADAQAQQIFGQALAQSYLHHSRLGHSFPFSSQALLYRLEEAENTSLAA